MASDPVLKVLRAAKVGRSITLNSGETRILAASLQHAAQRILAAEKAAEKSPRWWRRSS